MEKSKFSSLYIQLRFWFFSSFCLLLSDPTKITSKGFFRSFFRLANAFRVHTTTQITEAKIFMYLLANIYNWKAGRALRVFFIIVENSSFSALLRLYFTIVCSIAIWWKQGNEIGKFFVVLWLTIKILKFKRIKLRLRKFKIFRILILSFACPCPCV